MPPLAITKRDLGRLVAITAAAIREAVAGAYPAGTPDRIAVRRAQGVAGAGRAAA